jgi:hypothetical protein
MIFTLKTGQEPAIGVYVSGAAGPIERNAAGLFADEMERMTGVSIPVLPWDVETRAALCAIAIGNPDAEAARVLGEMHPEGAEGFEIRTAGSALILAGNTGSGVLYAVDHLLDGLECRENTVSIPETNVSDAPDCTLRGCTFTTHGYPKFMLEQADLDGMKDLIRFYARKRVNHITVEATGERWPGDLSPIVTFKHFPPLRDETRDADVALRRKMMNELIDYAHSWGVRVVLYTSEFNHPPDIYQRCPELQGVLPETWSEGRHNYVRGCMCLSKPIVWDYWRAKVVEAIEGLPELDGLELWTAEVPSEFGICACDDCRGKARHEWLERFYNATRSAMDEVAPGMPLYIKTFQSSQGALEVERFGPLKGKLPHDSTIVTKAQFGDMAYLNDPHPLMGWIQDGEEATEFDVGGEYRGCGLGAMICCVPEHIAERMRLYRAKGVTRFLARHALPTWPNKEFIDINDEAFYRLTWNLDTDVDEIWRKWADARFGPAAEKMIELLKLTDDVVNKSIYVRRACANRHYYIFSDNLDSFKYMLFDLSAFMIEGAVERLQPTPENIAAILSEKDEAIADCARMLDLYGEVKPMLPEEMAEKLGQIMQRMERVTAVMRPLTEAIWTYFQWERDWSIRGRDLLRPRILDLLKTCEGLLDESERMGEEIWRGQAFWGLRKMLDFERPRRLCEEIRGLVNFRVGQKGDYTVTVTPATVGHPNTYADHRRQLRSIFGLPGDG